MSNSKVQLHNLFLGLQEDMEKSLERIQGSGSTPAAKGGGTETDWLKMFNDYLPRRYKALKGFVIDSKGNRSDEIDIIIFDRYYSPFLFNHKGIFYVPAESVYCVFEVKPTLNKAILEYAGQKAASVRKLFRTSALVPLATGELKRRKLFNIFAGVIAFESAWIPPLGKSFDNCVRSQNLKNEQKIDLGCVLKHGSFDVFNHNNKLIVQKSNNNTSLIFFFLKLLDRLQRLGNVPAIEMDKYWQIV